MKDTISYYYGLNNIQIEYYDDGIYIKSNNRLYLFSQINNIEEIEEARLLLQNIPNYYQFILNKENKFYTPYKDKLYVLLKINNKYIYYPYKINIDNKRYLLDRSNWLELWENKNDYIEYEMKHIHSKYKEIDESIDYYIGMSEIAIAFLKYNLNNFFLNKTICHKRINEKDYYNPLNCIIDYKVRDLAEYLKYLFWDNKYQDKNIKDLINKWNLKTEEKVLVFSRLLYPSYYFDIYEKIINNSLSSSKLVNYIIRIKEYEKYLQDIFIILQFPKDIKKIDWL